MNELFLQLWRKRNGFVAGIATAAIGSHLFFRFLMVKYEAVGAFSLLTALWIGGIPILCELVYKLFKRDLGSDFLAGISIISSFFLNEYLAGVIVVLMLSGGKALEDYALRNASSVLRALAKRMPSVAHRLRDNDVKEIAVNDIAIGDTLVIFPHEICPVDGTVIKGRGFMDEAYLTGEPFVIDKTPGSNVISGAVNGETALTIRATKLAVDSRYSKIVQVLKTSEQNKAHLRRLADKLGAFYAPFALLIAGGTWVISGDAIRFLSVLMIATPCPLLIAIPIAVIGAISLAAKRGIVIKNPAILEQIEECHIAIFDKTGTLTSGQPQLSEIICAPGFKNEEILNLAAAVERYSKHPLARAVIEKMSKQAPLLEATEINEVPGEGLKGVVSGHKIQITSRDLVLNLPGSEHLPKTASGLECAVILDGQYAALFRFRDTPRPEGLAFIKHLGPKHHFKHSMIISGDRESEVRYLAEKVGVDTIYAGKSPEEKLAIVRTETLKNKTLFVGDGINDAPALMSATVGIAIGRNSDITSEASGAVIMDSSLAKVDELFHISRRMRSIALQSAIGGIFLSFVGMFFAAAGFFTPVLGAMIQEGIDLISIFNAIRTAWPPKELTDYA